jgi:hypothetical protein
MRQRSPYRERIGGVRWRRRIGRGSEKKRKHAQRPVGLAPGVKRLEVLDVRAPVEAVPPGSGVSKHWIPQHIA